MSRAILNSFTPISVILGLFIFDVGSMDVTDGRIDRRQTGASFIAPSAGS